METSLIFKLILSDQVRHLHRINAPIVCISSLLIRSAIVGTPYEGGIFKCKLVLDSEFPQKPPKGMQSIMSKIIFNTLPWKCDNLIEDKNPYFRILLHQNLPSQRWTWRRDLCEHSEERLEPRKLVSVPHLRSYQMPADSPIPREQSKWRSRQAIHGELWGFPQKCHCLHTSARKAECCSTKTYWAAYGQSLQGKRTRRAEAVASAEWVAIILK